MEQAIQYLSEEDGIIQHVFIEDLKIENICTICQMPREQHLIENNVFNNNIEINNIHSSNSINISTIRKNNSSHFRELEVPQNSDNNKIYDEKENNNNFKSKSNSINEETTSRIGQK